MRSFAGSGPRHAEATTILRGPESRGKESAVWTFSPSNAETSCKRRDGRVAGHGRGPGIRAKPASERADILRRLLLVYKHTIGSIAAKQQVRPQPVASAAGIIRSFVEDHHERQEELEVFPRFRQAGVQVNLLEAQYSVGRQVTDRILHYSTDARLRRPEGEQALRDAMEQYVRIYEPHAAREDTVLFPRMRGIIPGSEFDALSEKFDARERKRFGAEDGTAETVKRVVGIEEDLGLNNLAQFTPLDI